MAVAEKTTGEPRVYSVPEVAEALRISRVLIYRACRRGEIPHVRVGCRVVIPAWWLQQQLSPRQEDARAGRVAQE